MFPTELPTELVILILSYLPLSGVCVYRSLIGRNDMNRETIYRDLAFYEGFIPWSTTLLENLGPNGLYSGRSLAGVKGWKEFCKKRRTIELAWAGRAPSCVVPSPRPLRPHSPAQTETKPESMHYRRVHRIKVDEKVGITVATTQLGGLIVRDLETDVVLWELPVWYVRGYAHLEYGEGYLIFDRDDGNKEVWKRTADIPAPSSNTSMNTSLDTDDSTDSEPEVDRLSLPDERQRHVTTYISHLTSFSSPPTSTSTSTSSSSSSPDEPPNARARFTPHAILHMPEPTRAFRFVYPHLLVASLERAFIWDVRIGKIVETVEGIQVIQPNVGGAEEAHVHEDEHDHNHGDDDVDIDIDEEDRGEGPSNLAVSAAPVQVQSIGNVAHDLVLLADVLPPPTHISSSTGAAYHEPQASYDAVPESHSEPESDDEDLDEDDNEDEDDADTGNQLPQFLGLVRYVDISPRHLFFAGRYLLRVFSRSTGKCVMDIPSTRWRYGRWRWEVASQASSMGLGVGQGVGCDGDMDNDCYDLAREEEREVVRMPSRCSAEEYSNAISGKMVIDQFVAVHASSDGKHLVALLSGSRLVIIHNFESLLTKRPSTQPARRPGGHAGPATAAMFSPAPHIALSAGVGSALASAFTVTPTSVVVADGSTSTSASASGPPSSSQSSQQGRGSHATSSSAARAREARRARREAKEKRRKEQREKDEEIFVNTLDVQLGPPSASTSVYLSYENGRIGVVTSNAVYVVIPTIPSSPPPSASSPSQPSTSTSTSQSQALALRPKHLHPTPPSLSILRMPYFSNPSWLSEVSCLMMSDTGLYLNWNPTWPRLGEEFGAGGGAGAVVLGQHIGAWVGLGGGAVGAGGGVHGIGGGAAGGAGVGAGGVAGAMDDGGGLIADLDVDASNTEEKEERERMMDEWERDYERDLEDYERYEEGRYHVFPNGDMFVAAAPRDLEESEVSMIYRVDLAPVPEDY
ncbi:hypothetical protein CPB84DRAFT_1796902 [Gymnopilus junonius]|uniref:F-box domain-containing protein n=1 Tax=Gymnopilus junonius TaxID=109634 RepID=A0A9P5N8R7_GYMJU|nr:hypothetical protein CPB84DRAFT_1796902 [Gymnopilus junonius]